MSNNDKKVKTADIFGIKEEMQSPAELEFAIFCIENAADKLNMKGNEVYKLLTEKSDILYDYIIPCYDVLHTQSKEYIVNDIIEFMKEKGVLN